MRVPWLPSSKSQDVSPSSDDGQHTDVTPNARNGVGHSKAPSTDVEAASVADQNLKLRPDESAQAGVRAAEAVTLSWSKKALLGAFINMWFLYFTNALQSNANSNLSPYVVSVYEGHSLLTAIYVVSNVMSGVFYLPVAKILDVWGRPAGLAFTAGVATLGLVLMATASTIATYGAAQVFYSIGFSGMIYSVDVITADSSSLKSRGLAYAFTSSPWMITAFAGPKIAELFYNRLSWRWGFGCFSIILPFVALPMFLNLWVHKRRAEKTGLLIKQQSERSAMESIWYYVVEFDMLGVVVLAAGLALFLLPFSLADAAPNGWSTGYIIAMLVVGLVLLLAFGPVERYISPKPFLPWRLLTERTLLATCMLAFTYQIGYYCWNSYFTSFLQVVNNLTLAQAGYVSSTFDVVSGIFLFLVGFAIRKTGHFKWLLYMAVPMYTLGQGLMIYFRRPGSSVGYIVMCQVFIALGGSTMIICEQVAVLAVAEHGEAAAVLALLGLFGYMGGAVGNAISGAIWTNTFPQELQRRLPESAMADFAEIYGDLAKQLSYPQGTQTRDAIVQSYAVAQTRMLTAGTAIMALTLACVFLIKNINVAKIEQVKGTLF